MKFTIKGFFSKCDQIHRNLRISSHLLRKSWMENFIFCTVLVLMLSFFMNSCIFVIYWGYFWRLDLAKSQIIGPGSKLPLEQIYFGRKISSKKFWSPNFDQSLIATKEKSCTSFYWQVALWIQILTLTHFSKCV